MASTRGGSDRLTSRILSPAARQFGRIAISVALLGVVVAYVGPDQIEPALDRVPWYLSAVGVGLLVASQLVAAKRLQILLHAQGVAVPFRSVARITFLGLFASNFLPSTIGGDAARVVAMRRDGIGTGLSAGSIVADRLINLVAVLLLGPTILAVPDLLPWGDERLVWTLAALALALAVALALAFSLARRAGKAPGEDDGARPLAGRALDAASGMLERWRARPTDLSIALALSWVSFYLAVAPVWLACRYLDLPVDPLELTAVVVILYILNLVPISFNGLGVQEVSIVYLLTRLGGSATDALALALLVRVFYVGTSLVGAFDLRGRRVDVRT